MDISHAQRGPWSPGRRAPRKVAILPREVSFAARNYQNGLPAPLARDRGAPHTQLGHPVTWAALGARIGQVIGSVGWLTPSPRRRESPHAHHVRDERAERVWVGLGISYSVSPRR